MAGLMGFHGLMVSLLIVSLKELVRHLLYKCFMVCPKLSLDLLSWCSEIRIICWSRGWMVYLYYARNSLIMFCLLLIHVCGCHVRIVFYFGSFELESFRLGLGLVSVLSLIVNICTFFVN